MARTLIASLFSPTGRYSAKVYSNGPKNCLESHIFVLDLRQPHADLQTESWGKAMHETTHSLQLADAMDAEALKVAQPH